MESTPVCGVEMRNEVVAAFTVDIRLGSPWCLANNWLGTKTFIRSATNRPSINQGVDSTDRSIKCSISNMRNVVVCLFA